MALRSAKRLLRNLEVQHDENLTYSQLFLAVCRVTRFHFRFAHCSDWQNDDLLPVMPEKRTWRAWNFVAL